MSAPVPEPRPRRGWRDLLRWRPGRRRATLFFDRGYGFAIPATPIDPLRGEKVLTALTLRHLLDPRTLRQAPPASLRQLLRVHDAAYLESLGASEGLVKAFGELLTETQRERALTTQRAMTGGTIAAAEEALAHGGIAVNVGGGFHHAHRAQARGFCLFNDVAVAVAELREAGFDSPVLVVDLDLHDGDGTRRIFAEDPNVYTFSLHNRHWDAPEALAATALELGPGIGDAPFLEMLRETLPPVFAAHRPALVFYVAGCDPAADDALGDWRLSAEAMLARDRFVTALARADGRELPLVVVLGGGYGPRAWRYTYRYVAWLLGAGDPPPEPPDDDEVVVARYAALARLLDPAALTGAAPAEDSWGLTPEDLVGSLAVGPTDALFLGYYTRHGLELALEQAGVLDRLRDLGYERPTVELDLTPGRHTLRVFGDAQRRQLVIEVRLRRDRHTLPGFELLAVDWMLLQHPRGRFTAERPALPGQRHPGLGMLKDAIALLVQVCVRLGLDGLTFTPSHYHLVQQSTRHLRMLDPADAALFEALQEALAGVPLQEAARRVEEEGLVDERTGEPFRWRGMPMLLALSDALRQRWETERWEERRLAERARLRFRLRGPRP